MVVVAGDSRGNDGAAGIDGMYGLSTMRVNTPGVQSIGWILTFYANVTSICSLQDLG